MLVSAPEPRIPELAHSRFATNRPGRDRGPALCEPGLDHKKTWVLTPSGQHNNRTPAEREPTTEAGFRRPAAHNRGVAVPATEDIEDRLHECAECGRQGIPFELMAKTRCHPAVSSDGRAKPTHLPVVALVMVASAVVEPLDVVEVVVPLSVEALGFSMANELGPPVVARRRAVRVAT
jgi:hypothetical protein